jgi:hypothetical protein
MTHSTSAPYSDDLIFSPHQLCSRCKRVCESSKLVYQLPLRYLRKQHSPKSATAREPGTSSLTSANTALLKLQPLDLQSLRYSDILDNLEADPWSNEPEKNREILEKVILLGADAERRVEACKEALKILQSETPADLVDGFDLPLAAAYESDSFGESSDSGDTDGDDDGPWEEYHDFGTLQDVKLATSSNCHLCSIVCANLKRERVLNDLTRLRMRIWGSKMKGTCMLTVEGEEKEDIVRGISVLASGGMSFSISYTLDWVDERH